MTSRALSFVFIILFTFCKNVEEKDLCQYELQPVKKYSLKIYEICINSDFAFTDERYKTLIFNNEEEFDANGGYEINGKIGEWISEDTLTIYRFDNKLEQPKDTIAKISLEKYGELNFKIFNYGAVNSGSLNEYSFDKYELKGSKIIFHGTKRILGPEIETNFAVNLGNVKIETNLDTITKITFDRVKTSMDFTYHNPDGSITNNLAEIKILTTYLYPKRTTKLLPKKLDRVFTDVK